ncbi:MAG TPA: FAD-dependent oxidoreductase [Nocardioidaceae bacterium]|nr:FAD-dependent oxidoreductase [Nocardioidaceae bacterium]
MPYVVTQSCCADASCVLACPVNCIHPAPGEPGFATAEMLYVDPKACVDCGACATACPVDAVKPHTKLTAGEQPFVALNAAYFDTVDPHLDRTPLALVPAKRPVEGPLRVAVVGAGPAGMYAADELLKHSGVTVDVFDRLPTPYGLVRAGVAPDHPTTRQVTTLFRHIEGERGFSYVLGVEVGKDIRHDDLMQRYGAVVYTVGAATDRTLGIEGEELPGSASATHFVAWYNGHPDHTEPPVALDSERAVVIGNGNVALDVARILATDPARLETTDIADHALEALRASMVREVVLLGRRGPEHAAFTLPELIGLAGRTDIDVVVEGELAVTDDKTALLAELAARPKDPARRRIVLRFHTSPVRLVGGDRVSGLEVSSGDVIEAGVVLRAIGYRGVPVPDLPFDEATGTVPNDHGRVAPGVYVAGWIKRGPSGFIGTNKTCAEETVDRIFDDLEAGLLTTPMRRDLPEHIDLRGWRAIDRLERETGAAQGRPRVKLTDRAALHAAATRTRRRGRRRAG